MKTALILATNQQRSVIAGLGTPVRTYTPYGAHRADHGASLAFASERLDICLGLYVLGNGARGYSPQLMRMSGPDACSPFGAGGINAYAYCAGDPVNRVDRTGHWPELLNWAGGIPRKLIGPMYSIDGAAHRVVERSVARILGQKPPAPPGIKNRLRDITIFYSSTFLAVTEFTGAQLINADLGPYTNFAVTAGATAHTSRVLSSLQATAQRARAYDLSLPKVAMETAFDLTGLNWMLGRDGTVAPANRVVETVAHLRNPVSKA